MKVDEKIIEAFRNALREAGKAELAEEVRVDEIMKSHTSFRVGGPADLFAEPKDTEEIAALISAAKALKIPFFLMGNGSNLVISDEGIEGLVIHLGEKFSHIESEPDPNDPEKELVRVTAGTLLTRLSSFATKSGLAGLEFASGIPGSVGGAVFMNAGAYDHDMSEVVEEVSCITKDGQVKTVRKEELDFSYRNSVFMKEGGIVTEALLSLSRGNAEEISSKVREYTEKRTKSQPLNFPSAGSMFKRPVGHYTGALIEQCGLKGTCVGGAQVSEKHAGFVINKGDATASDIDGLVKKIQSEVKAKFDVDLEREVRFIGRGFSSPTT